MIEKRETELRSSDVFDYITPAVNRKDWPSSIGQFNKDIKESVYNGRTVIIGVFGPPGSGKTTTLRRILSEIPSELITKPIEWGDVSESKSFDNARKTKSSTRVQGWKLSVLLAHELGWERRVASFESPLTTSFPIEGRPMLRTSDRGLTTLIRLASRDSQMYSGFPFDLFVFGLFGEPDLEYSMKITRDLIAHRLEQKPKDLRKALELRGIKTNEMSNRAVRTMSLRVILEDKGMDTSDLSGKDILSYAQEAADLSAIEGIDEATDEVTLRLAEQGIIDLDKTRYSQDRHYRLEVLSQRFMPKLFDSLGRPSGKNQGRNVFFVGTVARAERIKMHPLKLT